MLLKQAESQLALVCDNPGAEAEWLLAHVLGCTRAALRTRQVSAADERQFARLLSLRLAGEPLAYVTGEQPFRHHSIAVSPAVLIPRPETEQVVDWALALVKPGQAVLDACTGSGCIAISLALEMTGLAVTGSDVSAPALAVAQANAKRLKAQVEWLAADGLALPGQTGPFHLIVSNPPYIANADEHLAALGHEPLLALVSGEDGLDLIRRLITDAPQHLHRDGWLLLEHGYDQAAAVQQLMQARGFVTVESHRDYGGQWRATQGRWAG